MNCEYCHLQIGTAFYANNFVSVASLYSKLKAKSGYEEEYLQKNK